jgi:hypothetical protein
MSLPVPDTLEAVLDPDWLSAALGRRYPGVTVLSVQAGPVVSRVSTNARFRVHYQGEAPLGLPADLCVKGYFSDCSDTAAASRQAGVPEALFYRHLARTSGVRTLDCVYADVDQAQQGVLITEDVVARGATFLDALSPYSPDQVAESLGQYALLHGRSWGKEGIHQPWLGPRLEATMRARGLPQIIGNFEGPIGSRVPEQVRDAERLVGAVRRLADQLPRAEPRCLLHGDAHIGNLYLDAALTTPARRAVTSS